MTKSHFFIAFVVSLGGFLFGFDAGIISGVMNYAGPEFELTELQNGWVVSSPSFAAMLAMIFSGKLSDVFGRKKLLIIVALLYAISAILSAFANSYELLYIARMIGGLAFGAALVLAPLGQNSHTLLHIRDEVWNSFQGRRLISRIRFGSRTVNLLIFRSDKSR